MMSLTKVLGIKDNVMSCAANVGSEEFLSHAIEETVADARYVREYSYGKRDVIQLITSIEREKISFLRGNTTLKYLYTTIDSKLGRFRMHHPNFDYLTDPAMNAYFS